MCFIPLEEEVDSAMMFILWDLVSLLVFSVCTIAEGILMALYT